MDNDDKLEELKSKLEKGIKQLLQGVDKFSYVIDELDSYREEHPEVMDSFLQFQEDELVAAVMALPQDRLEDRGMDALGPLEYLLEEILLDEDEAADDMVHYFKAHDLEFANVEELYGMFMVEYVHKGLARAQEQGRLRKVDSDGGYATYELVA